ncbi:hypothetical protein O1L60_43455 [Streptomyces diastatochromogenes]|nr:hypothetical protein [Streptomyces diastatochromogenes]
MLLAGLGAWHAGAGKVLRELGDRLGALFATTVMAGGLFRESPWSLGVCGGFASPEAAALMGEADVVLAFGASLDTFTLHGGRILDPAATVVQVDLTGDTWAQRADLTVRGDAHAVAVRLLDAVGERALPVSAWREHRAPAVAGARAGWTALAPRTRPAPGGSTRAPSPGRWPSCSPRSARWCWTAGTSSPGRPCTGPCPTPPDSCSPAPPSRASAWASPVRSAPPSGGPTG